MTDDNLDNSIDNTIENPLIWPLLSILKASQKSFKIHYLASQLQDLGLLPDLDKDPNKALFKRNFLLMNALYQLQNILLPEQWLQVKSLDIQLMDHFPDKLSIMLEQEVALRSYYLNWDYFETSTEEIDALLSQFWQTYRHDICKSEKLMRRADALKVFQLDGNASEQNIRRQWRKLALKWHPDRASGNVLKFRQMCDAWQILRP